MSFIPGIGILAVVTTVISISSIILGSEANSNAFAPKGLMFEKVE
tara:strand:- start:9085 stop:9219 length:135 start_codon:yes stop_codon:yes gene_type:complete